MKKYRCTICGYIYDEEREKVKFSELPDDWKCPLCGAPKSMFEEIKEEIKTQSTKIVTTENLEADIDGDLRELSNEEIAFICSNLSKACEKEYMEEEKNLFIDLYNHYEELIEEEPGSFVDIAKLIEKDKELFSESLNFATKCNDSGSKRVLTWASKTTNIIKTILDNYKEQGLDYLKNTKIWVCDICGFIYIGDNSPLVCPICKVPNMKIMEVK